MPLWLLTLQSIGLLPIFSRHRRPCGARSCAFDRGMLDRDAALNY
jgi:hypothetical protein